MFKNEFQGGASFEVFSAQGKDSVGQWKLNSGNGSIKKLFDKEVKSFVYSIEGSTPTTKMQLPKDNKQSLTLTQRFLVIQLSVSRGSDLSLDLGVSDMSGQRRRLALSTTYKDTQFTPLHSKIPLGFLKRTVWLNLVIDMLSLVGDTWNQQTHQCIESVCVSGTCRLRRIFTMKAQAQDTTDDHALYGIPDNNVGVDLDDIPRQYQFGPDIPNATQVINSSKVRCFEGKGKGLDPLNTSSMGRTNSAGEIDLNGSGGRRDNYHIAFGTKVSGAGQTRKGSGKDKDKDGSTTCRQSHSRTRSDAGHDSYQPSTQGSSGYQDHTPDTSRRERKNSDPGRNLEDPELSVDKDSLRTSHTWTDGADNGKEDIPFVRPHPPRLPSSDKRRRPRVKSHHSHIKEELTLQSVSSVNSSPSHSQGSSYSQASTSRNSSATSQPGSRGSSGTGPSRLRRLPPQPKMVANDDEVEDIMRQMHEDARRDNGRSETESEEPSSHNTSGTADPTDADDSMSEIISTLKASQMGDTADIPREFESEEEEDADGEEEDEEGKTHLYTYSSRPKVAPGGQNLNTTTKPVRNALNSRHRARGKRRNQSETTGDVFSEDPGGGDRARYQNENSSDDDAESAQKTTQMKRPSPRNRTRPQKPGRSGESKPRNKERNDKLNGAIEVAPPVELQTHHFHHRVPPEFSRSPYGSLSRTSISKRSLREISADDVRLSGGKKTYKPEQYQENHGAIMEDLSESCEKNMLALLKRQAYEGDSDSGYTKSRPSPGEAEEWRKNGLTKSVIIHDGKDSASSSGDSDTMATMKSQNSGRPDYIAEMVTSTDFLNLSNPREIYSPPIVFPSALPHANQLSPADIKLPPSLADPRKKSGNEGSDAEDELELLYDQHINCYFDPRTNRYYELA